MAAIIRLARRLGLDYSGMEADDFWLAGESGEIIGICGLKTHRDCLELCALGVQESWRRTGVGTRLVRAVLQAAGSEVYLATVIPDFFTRFGFRATDQIPSPMIKKADWCQGCRRELCQIMIRPQP